MVTSGNCKLCNKMYKKRYFTRHIKSCSKKNLNGQKSGYIVNIYYNNDYWLYLYLPKEIILSDIDKYLRKIWLECCGHLSIFRIDNKIYNSQYLYLNSDISDSDSITIGSDKELFTLQLDQNSDSIITSSSNEEDIYDCYIDDQELNMSACINNIFKENMICDYEYDMGSTTSLKLKVLLTCNSNLDEITLLAKNSLPQFPCEKCKKDAVYICTECQNMYCNICLRTLKFHNCINGFNEYYENIEDYLTDCIAKLDINSPRVGVCSYE